MKLVTSAKTKLYELTYLVAGDFTDSELTKVQETVQALVKKHKGSVKSEDAWGKKSLAYEIRQAGKNHREAHYVQLVVELESVHAPAFERDVYLVNEIIRHLFVEAEAGETTEETAVTTEPEKIVKKPVKEEEK
jgi:ribosomal protein S6